MNFDRPKLEPNKSFKKMDTKKVEKTELAPKPDKKPIDKPRNKIEHPKIDIQKEPRNKIKREKINLLAAARNKIERPKIDLHKDPKNKIQREKIDLLTPSRNKIKRPKFDPTAPTRNKIEPRKIDPKAPPRHKIEPRHINSKIEPKHKLQPRKLNPTAPPEHKIGSPNFIPKDPTDSTHNINRLNLEKVKKEIKNVDWERISDDWSITTRSNQYAEYRKVSLDPTKEVSKENPLYRHKEWLNKIYNDKNWKLNDKKIANICGVNPSVIGKWRKKHQISRKLQGEGWIDKRSGRVYIRVPQDYDHPELTKRAYRLEHIYNIEKYLSRLPELELSKKYLVDGKYLKLGTRVKYVNQDSKDNSVENLRINTNIVKLVEKEENLRSEKSINKTILKYINKEVEKAINRSMEPGKISKKIHSKGYRARITMPKDYNHPELTPNPNNRYERLAHTVKMERFLANNPSLELSKKYLIQGKYLRTGTEIHHINQIGNDNRIENLWIYESKKEHARGELTLYDSLKTLVSTNQILFKNEKYFINPDNDSRKTNPSELGLEIKRDIHINYKDLNLVKEEIKKIDWNSISTYWTVQVKKNQFVQKNVNVDPTRDCSENNPLHHHKEWLKRIVSDNRFNLTDSRLAELCGFTRDKARYWRERVHGIKGKTEWGFERRVDDKDGRIWIKVPKDYANPVVQKQDHHRRIMLEHRYVIEQHLAKHPELEISKMSLIDGKYLKPEAHVHHINLNYQDNRKENLWVFENVKEHNIATKSLYDHVEELLKSGKIRFKEGKYHTDT